MTPGQTGRNGHARPGAEAGAPKLMALPQPCAGLSVPGWGTSRSARSARSRGPIPDTFYARLKECGDLACSAARLDLQNTAARLGHGGGGATTLKHYADPDSEVDRRAAAYLAELTGGISQQFRDLNPRHQGPQ